jgi:hypothetical protein
MVPVVPLGCVDHPPQHWKAQPHVGVLEDREQRDEHGDAGEHPGLVAEQHEWEHGERLRESRVQGVQPSGRRPVHQLDAVVDGVKAPEQRHLVREAVTPVIADERDDDRQGDRHCPGHETSDAERADPQQRDRRHDDEHDRPRRHEQVVHEQMREVGGEPAPEHTLRPQREQLFERNEHQEEHGDPDGGVAAHEDGHEERGKERQPGHDPDPGRSVEISLLVHRTLGSPRCTTHSAPAV